MRRHYAVRAHTADYSIVKGELDITVSWFVSLIARLTGMLVPYSGKAVPVTVRFANGTDGKAFVFDRVFHYPARTPVRFRSQLEYVGGSELIEFMRFGFGWRCAYRWNGTQVMLEHRGYVWRIAGMRVPLPLHWILGRASAEETPEDSDSFSMATRLRHPWFGDTFAYYGRFTLTELACPDPS